VAQPQRPQSCRHLSANTPTKPSNRAAEWYARPLPPDDYRLDRENVLTFGQFPSNPRWPEKTTPSTPSFFPAPRDCLHSLAWETLRPQAPAVLLLPNWNAKWHGPETVLCHWIQRLGITVPQDEHALPRPPPWPRATNVPTRYVDPNIGPHPPGQTARAVQDLAPLPPTGSSSRATPGSASLAPASAPRSATSLSFTMNASRAGGFFHVSTYYADVIKPGP